MSITQRSLQKLLRDNISGRQPLDVSAQQAQRLVEDLLTRIEPLSKAERNDNCYYLRQPSQVAIAEGSHSADQPPSDQLCGCILLEASQERWYRNQTHLHLLRSPDQRLWVELGRARSPVPVSDMDEVFALAQAFQQRVEQQQARATKREKQRNLKTQAILAQVRKMAKEDQFDFATETDTVKLKLIIRLSDSDYFAVLIPFNKFKDVLPKLRTAIQTLRETYESGVRFKTHLKQSYRRSDWVRHQDL
jgi:hypothetical protein